jgi:hypothetical protein
MTGQLRPIVTLQRNNAGRLFIGLTEFDGEGYGIRSCVLSMQDEHTADVIMKRQFDDMVRLMGDNVRAPINCRYCQRTIVKDDDGRWVDPEADGDDIIWRETCESHDTFTAEHEPEDPLTTLPVGTRVRNQDLPPGHPSGKTGTMTGTVIGHDGPFVIVRADDGQVWDAEFPGDLTVEKEPIIGVHGIDLTRITIWKHGDQWRVWIPPTGPESYDTDGESLVGPFGDSFWSTFDAAVDFVRMVLAERKEP